MFSRCPSNPSKSFDTMANTMRHRKPAKKDATPPIPPPEQLEVVWGKTPGGEGMWSMPVIVLTLD